MEDGKWNLALPDLGTPCLESFYKKHILLTRFVAGLLLMFMNHEIHPELSKNLLDFVKARYQGGPISDKVINESRIFNSGLYKSLIGEIVLCRFVDSFLKYLIDLLALVFKNKPETMKSGQQETLEFILQFSTMEELIAAIAEKRVEEVSFYSMASKN